MMSINELKRYNKEGDHAVLKSEDLSDVWAAGISAGIPSIGKDGVIDSNNKAGPQCWYPLKLFW